jgi:hypothetical protein
MSNFDKVRVLMDAEIAEAYNRGVTDGLQHFDRLRVWCAAEPMDIAKLTCMADLEAAAIERKYPAIFLP